MSSSQVKVAIAQDSELFSQLRYPSVDWMIFYDNSYRGPLLRYESCRSQQARLCTDSAFCKVWVVVHDKGARPTLCCPSSLHQDTAPRPVIAAIRALRGILSIKT